jgi:transcriptional regulator with XRE-family HTH domain
MSTTNSARGDALRAAREAKPWTQAQLAAAAGVSPRTVIRAEAGGDATAETLMALCAALGIDSGSLPSGGGEREGIAPAEAETPQDPIPPVEIEPAAPHGRPFKRMAALVGLAFLCATSWHISWAATLAWNARDMPTLRASYDATVARHLARDLMAASRAVATGTPEDGGTWDGLFRNRLSWGFPDCPNLGFLQLATWDKGAACPTRHEPTRISVRAAGPTLVDVAVGPLLPQSLNALARMLPRDPRLKVTAAYSTLAQPPQWGLLQFDPAALAVGHIPPPSQGQAYLQIRIER